MPSDNVKSDNGFDNENMAEIQTSIDLNSGMCVELQPDTALLNNTPKVSGTTLSEASLRLNGTEDAYYKLYNKGMSRTEEEEQELKQLQDARNSYKKVLVKNSGGTIEYTKEDKLTNEYVKQPDFWEKSKYNPAYDNNPKSGENTRSLYYKYVNYYSVDWNLSENVNEYNSIPSKTDLIYQNDTKLKIQLCVYYLNDEERAVYNYLYEKYGHKKADNYITSIKPALLKRRASAIEEATTEFAKRDPVGAAIADIISTPVNVDGFVNNALNTLVGDESDVNDTAYDISRTRTAVKKTLTENKSPFVSAVINAGLSMGEMATALPTGPFAPYILGVSQASDSTYESLQRGANSREALVLSVANGAIEVVTEKIGLENLFKLSKLPPVKFGTVAKNVVKHAGIEGGEEFVSDILYNMADELIMGEKSQFNQLVMHYSSQGMSEAEARNKAMIELYVTEPAMSFATGAVSGMGYGSVGSVAGYFGNRNSFKNKDADYTSFDNIHLKPTGSNDIIYYSSKNNGGSEKYAEQGNESFGNKSIGRQTMGTDEIRAESNRVQNGKEYRAQRLGVWKKTYARIRGTVRNTQVKEITSDNSTIVYEEYSGAKSAHKFFADFYNRDIKFAKGDIRLKENDVFKADGVFVNGKIIASLADDTETIVMHEMVHEDLNSDMYKETVSKINACFDENKILKFVLDIHMKYSSIYGDEPNSTNAILSEVYSKTISNLATKEWYQDESGYELFSNRESYEKAKDIAEEYAAYLINNPPQTKVDTIIKDVSELGNDFADDYMFEKSENNLYFDLDGINYDVDLAISNIINGRATEVDFEHFKPGNTANRKAFYETTGIKLPENSTLTKYIINLFAKKQKLKNVIKLTLDEYRGIIKNKYGRVNDGLDVLTNNKYNAKMNSYLEKNEFTFENPLDSKAKKYIKKYVGWSDGIVDFIRTTEEFKVYLDIGLVETDIGDIHCLVQSEIDLDMVTPDKGATNRELMREGKAPYNKDGVKIELHHIGQKNNSPLAEIPQNQHKGKKLHEYGKKSEIIRKDFDEIRRKYWKKRLELLEKGVDTR